MTRPAENQTLLDSTLAKVEATKSKMRDNINIQIDNMSATEELYDKSEVILAQSIMLDDNARRLRRKHCIRNLKFSAAIALTIAIIIILTVILNGIKN